MLSTVSSDKMAWPVHLSIDNLSKMNRHWVKLNGFILIGLLPKCPNGPKAHTNRFTYHESIATILHVLEELSKSGIAFQCADGRTRHPFPQIASFLADYPEQCSITIVKNSWCPQCEICQDDMPGFACNTGRFTLRPNQ